MVNWPKIGTDHSRLKMLCITGGSKLQQSLWETVTLSPKTENTHTLWLSNPTLRYIPSLQICSQKLKTCIWMYIALFEITPKLERTQKSMDNKIDKWWYIHVRNAIQIVFIESNQWWTATMCSNMDEWAQVTTKVTRRSLPEMEKSKRPTQRSHWLEVPSGPRPQTSGPSYATTSTPLSCGKEGAPFSRLSCALDPFYFWDFNSPSWWESPSFPGSSSQQLFVCSLVFLLTRELL